MYSLELFLHVYICVYVGALLAVARPLLLYKKICVS